MLPVRRQQEQERVHKETRGETVRFVPSRGSCQMRYFQLETRGSLVKVGDASAAAKGPGWLDEKVFSDAAKEFLDYTALV